MIEKLINIAKNEIGYLEKKTNSQLDDKLANAGSNNYTKYARDLDNITGFYNGKKNGYAWCDVFVDWCFVQAFGVDKAKELLLQPYNSLGAGCVYSARYYKNAGQYHTSPKIGDQIFFKSGGSIGHTGLVYNVDSNYVYTIEGNTSSASGVIANGGCVAKKSYKLGSSYIDGYGRPKYDETPVPTPTPTPTPVPNTNKYCAYDNVKNKWLPSVTVGSNDYAGNLGNGISGVKIDNLTYRAHDKVKNKWLPYVTGSGDYAGNLPNDIDAIQIKDVTYRVYDNVKKKWLPWVTGTSDYAGNLGHSIGGIQIK